MIDFVGETTEYSESDNFMTLVRIRTTTNSPISNNWQVKFAIPDNKNITTVSRGQFTQEGSIVTIKSDPTIEPAQNMAILVGVTGDVLAQPRPVFTVKRPFRAQFEDLGSV
ncbi:hypothetical protein K7432_015827 [Basidiobolus ranarum]|uniref:CBM2 domain-containing protein n=1 Tax=Basidiobolus ranarum TaxID=34480 RepID=A0ABR2WFM5_9FUNG